MQRDGDRPPLAVGWPGAGRLPTPLECGEVFGFEDGEGSIEHFPARHDDDIQAGIVLLPPEQFPGQPFRPVPLDGAPIFRVAATPNRGASPPFSTTNTVMKRPLIRTPVS